MKGGALAPRSILSSERFFYCTSAVYRHPALSLRTSSSRVLALPIRRSLIPLAVLKTSSPDPLAPTLKS